jgi:hypothetical protein
MLLGEHTGDRKTYHYFTIGQLLDIISSAPKNGKSQLALASITT